MASARPAATTRRTSSRGSGKGDEAEISPARWAGVALVIAAIVGAIALAVVSPGDPGAAEEPAVVVARATPTPVPVLTDRRRPTVQPRIVSPSPGTTAEFEIPITVSLEQDELPKRLLSLVAFRGDDEIGRASEPKTGGKATVHAQLVPGDNELTVALEGPGGLGPRSEIVLLTLDTDAPRLAITAPENKFKTYDDAVRVTGTSEVGAEVRLRNEANDWDQSEVVGPSGEFAVTVPLDRGQNRIFATSTDSVGLEHDARVRVNRLDGRPNISIKVPARIKRSELPAEITVVVTVTDSKDRPMEGATVDFTLGGAAHISESESGTTKANGRSRWTTTIERSSSPFDEVNLGVTVTSATSGEQRRKAESIAVQ